MTKVESNQGAVRRNFGGVLDEEVVTVDCGGRRFDFVRRHTHADRVMVRPVAKGEKSCNSR